MTKVSLLQNHISKLHNKESLTSVHPNAQWPEELPLLCGLCGQQGLSFLTGIVGLWVGEFYAKNDIEWECYFLSSNFE